tara:strand:- start:797 stop:1012 length:216 start_codon:yes stop_codon:yes gene_type:complete
MVKLLKIETCEWIDPTCDNSEYTAFSLDGDGDVLIADSNGSQTYVHLSELANVVKNLLVAHNAHMKEQLND